MESRAVVSALCFWKEGPVHSPDLDEQRSRLGARLALCLLTVNSEFQADRCLLRDLYINTARGKLKCILKSLKLKCVLDIFFDV